MELPRHYKNYLSTLKERLQRVGFSQTDFEDISSNELMFDIPQIELLNKEVRSFKAFWTLKQTEAGYWPDDYLIIGGSGNGDYFCISRSSQLGTVYCFEHECLEFSEYATSLEDFYQKTIEIMRPRLGEST